MAAVGRAATLRLEDCDIRGSREVGVRAASGAAVTVVGCRVHDGSDAGVVALGEGTSLQVEGCVVWGNAAAGVEVREGAAASVALCTTIRGHTRAAQLPSSGYGVFVAPASVDKARSMGGDRGCRAGWIRIGHSEFSDACRVRCSVSCTRGPCQSSCELPLARGNRGANYCMEPVLTVPLTILLLLPPPGHGGGRHCVFGE